jgi:hypothetical protein
MREVFPGANSGYAVPAPASQNNEAKGVKAGPQDNGSFLSLLDLLSGVCLSGLSCCSNFLHSWHLPLQCIMGLALLTQFRA